MRAGLLRHAITVNTFTITRGAHNEENKTAGEYCSRNADIQPKNAREYFQDQQINAEITHTIRLRYDPVTKLISKDMVVVHDGVTYEIIAPPINVGMRNREIQLLCRQTT